MLSQALIFNGNGEVLMVRQYVQRGDIVWNFPGGHVEAGETAEEACVREVKEETGYDVRIRSILRRDPEKYTYLADIAGGVMTLDKSIGGNDDLLDVGWVRTDDPEKWDRYTEDILRFYQEAAAGR